jgi:hypothetical protein
MRIETHMGRINGILRWDGLRCRDVDTKFHKIWFKHSEVNSGWYTGRMEMSYAYLHLCLKITELITIAWLEQCRWGPSNGDKMFYTGFKSILFMGTDELIATSIGYTSVKFPSLNWGPLVLWAQNPTARSWSVIDLVLVTSSDSSQYSSNDIHPDWPFLTWFNHRKTLGGKTAPRIVFYIC